MTERSILLGASLWLSGCVSQSLGYSEVQSALEERTGYQARWSHVDSSESNALAERLLAKPLNADTAAQVALLNSPEVQVAFEELGLARADLVRAFRLPNPTAEAGLRFHPGQDTPDIDLAVMIDLTELATLPWSKQAQDSSVQAAQTRVAGQLLDIVLESKRAFYEYQAAEQQVQVKRSVVQAAGAALALAEQLHAAGNIPDLSLSLERARYDETRLELARAEARVTSAREHLNQQLGLWGHGTHWRATELAPPGKAPQKLASIEQRALQASLDLQTAKHRYAAAARRANLANLRGVLPELKAGVAAEREEDDWGVGPAVELELPIFYQGQGDVAAAKAEMRREHSRHAALAVRIRSAVRTAARNLVVTRDAANHYRERLLPERERIVQETQLMYNAMSVGAFELLQAKRDQVQTTSAYLDTLKDYWIARAELDQLLAGRLVHIAPLSSTIASRADPDSGEH